MSVLLVAFFGSPTDVGHYASGLVALLLVQAVGETALRQAAVLMTGSPDGDRFIARAAVSTGVIGTIIMVGVAAAIGHGASATTLALLPLAAVPLISTWYLSELVQAQRSGQWTLIARSQAFASSAALLLALPPLWYLPTASGTLQTALTEAIFGILIVRARRAMERSAWEPHARSPLRLYTPIAVSNVIAWGQGQGERISLSFVGSQATLGVYTFAASVTRTAVLAMVTGVNNHLRTSLDASQSDQEFKARLGITLRLTILAALAVQALSSAIAVYVVPVLFGKQWTGAWQIIPVLGCGLAMASITGVTTVLLIQVGKERQLIGGQLFGVVVALTAGVVLSHSLVIGATFSAGKDILLTGVRMAFSRRYFRGRDLTLVCLLAAAEAGLCVFLASRIWP